MFRKLGVNGISKLVQNVSQLQERLLCPALEQEVDRFLQAAELSQGSISLVRAQSDPDPIRTRVGESVGEYSEVQGAPESAAPRASLKRRRNSHEISGDESNLDNTRESLGLSAAECNTTSLAMLQASSESQRLLLITAALGGNMVPLDLIFRRLQSDQKRWSANGGIKVVTSSMAGLETSFGMIHPDHIFGLMAGSSHVTHRELLRTPDERYYTIPTPLKTSIIKHLLCSDDDKVLLQSLRLICFVLPRERLWEQDGSDNKFAYVTRILIPCLNHLLDQADGLELPLDLKEEVLQCVFVKAAIKPGSCEDDLVYAEQLLRADARLPQYLGALLCYRQSVLARLSAAYNESHNYIDKSLSNFGTNVEIDKRLAAWKLHLLVSRLKNLTMEEKFYETYSTLIKWDIPPPSTMSEMERQILVGYSLVASDILRSQGNLKLAMDYLLDLYRYPQLILHDPRRYKICTALIDIYCAMGEVDEAENLLSKETENMPSDMTKAKRRLLVSSLDVSIARRSGQRFKQARSRIAELEQFFQRHDTLDISDQLLHIRALVASARMYHLDSSFTQSIEEWERIKVLAGEYSAFRQKGFTYAFCELSIGYAQVLMALRSIGNAQTIFHEERDNFWIPVIVTDWLPMIRKELSNLLGKRMEQSPLIAE